jgi:sucrose-6-phosphate hydrolase SacC (GH32 family)
MMMALRYTHERAPAADARKPVRVVRRKNNTTTNNNERGVVEIEFRNKEEEKSGIRYRGVTSTSGGGGGGGRATTKTKKKKKKSDEKEEEEKETADDADEDEDEDDEDDDNVECAILFDGKTIELRVLDETVAGLRVQRKREDEEESGIVSKRLDIGDAADVKNKRKKVNL